MDRVLVSVLVLGIATSGAYFKGRSDEHKSYQRQQAQVEQKLLDAEVQRLAAQKELVALREKLNAEALADPDANRLSFGADSVSRLDSIK